MVNPTENHLHKLHGNGDGQYGGLKQQYVQHDDRSGDGRHRIPVEMVIECVLSLQWKLKQSLQHSDFTYRNHQLH